VLNMMILSWRIRSDRQQVKVLLLVFKSINFNASNFHSGQAE